MIRLKDLKKGDYITLLKASTVETFFGDKKEKKLKKEEVFVVADVELKIRDVDKPPTISLKPANKPLGELPYQRLNVSKESFKCFRMATPTEIFLAKI